MLASRDTNSSVSSPDDELIRARLAAIVAASAEAIIGETLAGTITDWNPAAERLYGYSAAEAIGQPLTLLVPPERLAEAQALRERVRQGEQIDAFETVRRTRDDRRIEVSLTVSPLRNEAGEVVAISTISRAVTESERLMRELHASEAKYRTLVEQLPAAVYVLADDERQTPLYFSPYIEQLTGETPEEALAFQGHWLDLVHPEDRERVAAEDLRTGETGELFRVEYRHVRTDGSYVWVRDECLPIRDETGRPIAWQGVLIDVTERVQRETAEAENRAKSLFLGMMSHELRTPMQSVLGYAALLLSGQRGPLTAEQSEDIRYIQLGAERVMTLIEQMLDLSEIDAGGLQLAIEPVDLGDIIEQVRREIAPEAAVKGLELMVALPASLPRVAADPRRLRQILLNLAGNAVKFTEKGSICIGAAQTDDGVDVIVRDTGVGIPADALPHIFEIFRQGDSSTTRSFSGAGLGLTVVRELAHLMGGSVRVESGPERGSTFTLHLPAAGVTPETT